MSGEALAQVGFEGLKQFIVVEQRIKLGQHDVGLDPQRGPRIEQMHRVVTLAQPGSRPVHKRCNPKAINSEVYIVPAAPI